MNPVNLRKVFKEVALKYEFNTQPSTFWRNVESVSVFVWLQRSSYRDGFCVNYGVALKNGPLKMPWDGSVMCRYDREHCPVRRQMYLLEESVHICNAQAARELAEWVFPMVKAAWTSELMIAQEVLLPDFNIKWIGVPSPGVSQWARKVLAQTA